MSLGSCQSAVTALGFPCLILRMFGTLALPGSKNASGCKACQSIREAGGWLMTGKKGLKGWG